MLSITRYGFLQEVGREKKAGLYFRAFKKDTRVPRDYWNSIV
jgi:hypothetical protein